MKSNMNRFKIVYVLQQISLAINILQIQSIIFIEHIKTIIEHNRCLQLWIHELIVMGIKS